MTNCKVLCVDDDAKILKGIERQLGDDFDITTAIGPLEALEIIDEEGPFAVVVSDMRMPEMNGVELLKRVREISPDSVRMILTGFAELNSTIEAVNEGHIFRFLAKPCSPEDMSSSLNDGLRQYALVEAEKELVEGTLHGSVKVLSEVLSLVSPLAFGQSTRVRATVDGILKRMDVAAQWQLEIAAMLSSLGCVAMPSDLLDKKFAGHALDREESKVIADHPAIAQELLGAIPRLDRVADIIAFQNVPVATAEVDGCKVPLESRILKAAIDFDLAELSSESSLHALDELKQNKEQYVPEVLEALCEYVKAERNFEFKEILISELREGMVLAEDIRDDADTLIMAKGQKITMSATRLLLNVASKRSIKEPVKTVVPSKAHAEPVAV